MAAGKWKLYQSAKEFIGDGTIDLDTNSFALRLFLSTSNCNTLTHDTLSDLTNEHASANGYTPQTVTMTWGQSGGTATLDSDNPVFTATGPGDIVAHWAVLIRTGTVNSVTDALLAVCYLNHNGGSPLDVTATNGNTLTVSMNAAGIVALSGATSDT